MKRKFHINPENPDSKILKIAADALVAGRIIAHPTETVYGMAAVWDDPAALAKISSVKGRKESRPFSIMVGDISQIMSISGNGGVSWQKFLEQILPGSVTVVVPRKKNIVYGEWNRLDWLGFRLPDYPLCRRLVEMTGRPLITTSANLSGRPPVKTAREISPEIAQNCAIVLDGGACPVGEPSAVIRVNPAGKTIEILREGGQDFRRLENIFKSCFIGGK